MNYSNETTTSDDAKSVIVKIAERLILGKIDTLEGCRQLVNLHHTLDDNSRELFLPLVGIVSETDDFPVGDERSVWMPESLVALDQEKEKYLGQVSTMISSTCRTIISKLG